MLKHSNRLKHGKAWVLSAVLMLTAGLPVDTPAQITAAGVESYGHQGHTHNHGKVVRDSDGIPHIAAATEREGMFLQGRTHYTAADVLDYLLGVPAGAASGSAHSLAGMPISVL